MIQFTSNTCAYSIKNVTQKKKRKKIKSKNYLNQKDLHNVQVVYKQASEVKNFTKFTRKHLSQSYFFNKVKAFNTFFTEHLQRTTFGSIEINLQNDLNSPYKKFHQKSTYYCNVPLISFKTMF